MERWLAVRGYAGRYEVSNEGSVRNMEGKYLAPRLCRDGYVQYCLFKRGKPKYLMAHRVVAEAYLYKGSGKDQVNHKDHDRTNNHVSNLEWVTAKENCKHRSRNIAHRSCRNVNNTLVEEQVLNMRWDYRTGEFSFRELAQRYAVSPSQVSKIINRQQWAHI